MACPPLRAPVALVLDLIGVKGMSTTIWSLLRDFEEERPACWLPCSSIELMGCNGINPLFLGDTGGLEFGI